MAGPWEDFQTQQPQQTAGPAGPWNDFAPAAPVTPSPSQVSGIAQAVWFGLQNSATGLAIHGKMPDQQLGENAPWYERLSAGVGSLAADLPLSVAGLVGGAAAGTAVAPGLGTAVGAGAGAFAAPMALRDALVEAYTHNYASSWQGVWEIAKSAALGGAKGAAIGGVTGGAGKLVTPLVEGAAPIVAGSVKLGTELSAMTATSAAVEGHMPTWQDFMDNAILLGGLKAAGAVSGGLRKTYAATGKTPAEVVADVAKDPQAKAELEAGEVPKMYTQLALDERIKAAVSADPRPDAIRQVINQTEPATFDKKPNIKDPIAYEYITDQDTLKGVLRATEDMYQKEIEQQTRGVVTNKATAAEALKMVSSGDIADHAIGAAENAAQLYGRAHILKGVTQSVFDKLQAIKDVPEADLTPRMKLDALASIEQLSMVMADFRGARAEAGRALQVFQKMKADASVIGDAENLLKVAERKSSLQDLARLVGDLKDPAQLQRFADAYNKASTLEKVLEGWKAAVLSGPQTHLANILGNANKWLVDLPESALTATITAAMRKAQGNPLTMAQYKARALAPLYGVQMGAADAVKAAVEAFKVASPDKGEVYRTAIEGKKGDIIRIPFRLLQSEDALFRTMAERAQAHIMANDRAVAEGLHPSTAEFREAVVKYTDNPAFGLSEKAGVEALNKIEQAGAEGVFSQRLGPRMESVQRALAGSPMSFVVPFFRTPVNLLSWAVQHVPGLNLMSSVWRDDFAAGGEQRARAISRVAIGAGLSVAAYSLAQQGLITGGGLFNPEQRSVKAAAGVQPYSIKIGDKYYSYQRMEPVSKVLGIAADLFEMSQATKDPEDKAKAAAMLTMVFANATVSTTYLSGLSNAMQGATDPQRYGANLLEQYASSLVPKIVGQTAATVDPYKREVDGVMDAIQSQIPFMREKLLPKRDVWGEPVENNKWFAVMPIATTEASHDKVRTEAMRLQLAIADVPKFLEEKGPFNPTDKRIKLSDDQRDIMKQVQGKNAMTLLSPIVNSADWQQIPDFAKAEIYRRVLEGTLKQGKYAALPPDDASRVKLREDIVNRIIKETNEAQGAK